MSLGAGALLGLVAGILIAGGWDAYAWRGRLAVWAASTACCAGIALALGAIVGHTVEAWSLSGSASLVMAAGFIGGGGALVVALVAHLVSARRATPISDEQMRQRRALGGPVHQVLSRPEEVLGAVGLGTGIAGIVLLLVALVALVLARPFLAALLIGVPAALAVGGYLLLKRL